MNSWLTFSSQLALIIQNFGSPWKNSTLAAQTFWNHTTWDQMLYFRQLLGKKKKKKKKPKNNFLIIELISVVTISLGIVALDDIIMDVPTAVKTCLTLSPTFHQKELALAQIHKRGCTKVQWIH